MTPSQTLIQNISEAAHATDQLINDATAMAIFGEAVLHVIDCYKKGGRLYIAGNGGSAADAQHLAAEFVVKLARNRNPLPAEALTTDSSIITAISNDYGYERVFSKQLAGKLKKHDVFLGITTSGHSRNILLALDECRAAGVKSIIFTGRDGGAARSQSNYCVIAPGKKTSTIQEIHSVLAHTLCECVENALFPI